MSVDNTTNYPTNSVTTGGAASATSEAMASLSEAFAKAFRTSLTGTAGGSSLSSTLMENSSAAERQTELDRAEADRAQKRSETAADPFSTDRKSLDRSEVRQGEMENEYLDHRDKRGELRQDSDHKNLNREFSTTLPEPKIDRTTQTAATNVNVPFTMPVSETISVTNTAAPTGVVVNSVGQTVSTAIPEAKSVVTNTAIGPETITAAALNTAAAAISNPAVVVSVPTAAMPSTAIPTALQATASVLTIFTASGKLADDREEEERREEEIGKKKEKRKQGTAFFGEAMTRAFGAAPDRKHAGKTALERIDSERLAASPGRDDKEFRTPSPVSNRDDEKAPAELLRLMQPVRPTEVRVEPSEPSPPDPTERILLIQRVAAACHSAVQRTGPVRIKLNLDRFGSMTLRMVSRKTDDGRDELSVCFEPESETVARFLRENLSELRDTLAERGVVLGDVEIENGDSG